MSIKGADFLRLVEKSRVVRASFEQLNRQRRSQNARAEAEQEEDDPVLKKAASR